MINITENEETGFVNLRWEVNGIRHKKSYKKESRRKTVKSPCGTNRSKTLKKNANHWVYQKDEKDLPLSKKKYAKTKKRKYTFKSPTSRQEKRMDEKFAILLKLKRNLTCERCGSQYKITDNGKIPPGCQCSHFIGRTKRATRWLYANTYCHCGGCHQYLGNHPHEFRAWVLKDGGHTEQTLQLLVELARPAFRGDRSAIELWIDQELLIELPKWPRLNYPALEPLYEKLEEHNDSI